MMAKRMLHHQSIPEEKERLRVGSGQGEVGVGVVWWTAQRLDLDGPRRWDLVFSYCSVSHSNFTAECKEFI